MDYKTKRPLLFLIYPANTSDCQIFEDVLENLKRRGFLKPGTIVMADKGFCSYYNYNVALKRYRIVPVIWLKENMNLSKLLSMVSTPLSCFLENNMKELAFSKKLVKILVGYLKKTCPNNISSPHCNKTRTFCKSDSSTPKLFSI